MVDEGKKEGSKWGRSELKYLEEWGSLAEARGRVCENWLSSLVRLPCLVLSSGEKLVSCVVFW